MPSATAHSRRRRSTADLATPSLCPSEPRASIFVLISRALTALTIFLPATPIAGSACHPPRCPSISAGQFLLCRSRLHHHHLFDRFMCPSFGFTAVHAEDSLLLSSVDAIFTGRREPTEGSRFSTLWVIGSKLLDSSHHNTEWLVIFLITILIRSVRTPVVLNTDHHRETADECWSSYPRVISTRVGLQPGAKRTGFPSSWVWDIVMLLINMMLDLFLCVKCCASEVLLAIAALAVLFVDDPWLRPTFRSKCLHRPFHRALASAISAPPPTIAVSASAFPPRPRLCYLCSSSDDRSVCIGLSTAPSPHLRRAGCHDLDPISLVRWLEDDN
ncbi:hypothetical protein ZIOFF_015611 [Zingiber officinale]|uniref:Uncharacterized protein n=1 Tax=Zingiber officinale TaxID=94328 RepID=A0A8J5LWJ4_ZINOF|nr:hypothetical protein ZIOFF_015611 [Zingiber officinale]